MSGVVKWTLTDGTDTMKFAHNPTTMTTPYAGKDIRVSTAQLQTVMNPAPASEWSFEGNVYTEDEYAKLVLWHNKDGVLILTDHLLRSWHVVSTSLDITDRKDTARNNNRYTYTWKMLMLGRAS